jgi:hypothetical protein
MQLLILAHALDTGAQSVAMTLSPLLDYRLTVLRPEWLGQANWLQRTDGEGRAHTQLCWRNGHRLDSSQIGLLWNRTRMLPQITSRLGGFGDRAHSGVELQALVSSWLTSMDDRVEPSLRRHGSITPLVNVLQWSTAAANCGLALASVSAAAEDFSLLRTPLELWGPAGADCPAALARACHDLAEELGFAVLSLGFRGTPGAPQLCRVDAHPALATPGEVQAVARWLAHSYDASLSLGAAPAVTA